MRITISCIAKLKSGPELQLIEGYLKQLNPKVVIKEEEAKNEIRGFTFNPKPNLEELV